MEYALGAPQYRYQSEWGSRKTLGDPHAESCRNSGNQQGGVRGKRGKHPAKQRKHYEQWHRCLTD